MNKTILITGASGNMGMAVTRTFLEKGYQVIATITSDSSRNHLPAHNQLKAEVIDLSDETATTELIQRMIKEYGKIDGALMLTGGFKMGDIAATGSADIQQQIKLNFETAYHVARPLLAHMIKNDNGRLVFVGARPAIKPSDGKNMIAYALSKSLLFHLAECINAEVKGKNISATVIVPSTLDTPQNRESMPGADPSKWVSPDDVARILEFVCSDTAASLRESILKIYKHA